MANVVRKRFTYFGLIFGLAIMYAAGSYLWHEGFQEGNWFGGIAWFVGLLAVGGLMARYQWRRYKRL